MKFYSVVEIIGVGERIVWRCGRGERQCRNWCGNL